MINDRAKIIKNVKLRVRGSKFFTFRSSLFTFLCTFAPAFKQSKHLGEMVEWSITVVLKTTVLRGTGGSNPSLSADKSA